MPTLHQRLADIASDALETRDYPLATHLALNTTHVPELVEIARTWPGSWNDETSAGYLPLLACRALAQLGDVAAVTTLLEMLDVLDEADDDSYLPELPRLALAVGTIAIDPLVLYLEDRSHRVFPRVAVTDALERIAVDHETERPRIVRVLAEQLAQLDARTTALGGNLVGALMELEAVEHADAIRLAFDSGFVDPMVCGRWEDVAWELGVGPKPPPKPVWDLLPDVAASTDERSRDSEARLARDPAARAKNKAARKRQKAARKKSRPRR